MRLHPLERIEPFRVPDSPTGEMFGCFRIPLRDAVLTVISSGSLHPESPDWEHVSVSTSARCPTWEEMCLVKDLFWMPEELVIQFHAPASKHINIHKYCLHLWHSRAPITMPPEILV